MSQLIHMDLSELQSKLEEDPSFSTDPNTKNIKPGILSKISTDSFKDIICITKFCVKKDEDYSEYIDDLFDLLNSLHDQTESIIIEEKKKNEILAAQVNQLNKKDQNLQKSDGNVTNDIDSRIQSFNQATEQMIQNLEKRENHLDAYMAHMKEEFDNYLNQKSTK